MKHKLFPAVAGLIIIFSAFTFIKSLDWNISENYSVKFDGGDPAGEFRGLKGTVKFDPENLPASKFDCTVAIDSINTGNGMKNTHAKSAKWLDADTYPVIRFTSESIKKSTTGYDATGILDFHGVQKKITIPFTFTDNVFSGSFEINRLDYNINKEEPHHGNPVLQVTLKVPVSK